MAPAAPVARRHLPRLNKTRKEFKINLGNYIRHLVKFVFSSSLILGVITGAALLLFGGATMNLDVELDFGAYDGIWVMLGLPLISLLIFVILSPISFLVYRALTKKKPDAMPP